MSKGLLSSEPVDHVIGPLRLVMGDQVASITHHHLDKARHLPHIACHLLIDLPHIARRLTEFPGHFPLQTVQEVLSEGIGDDDVQLAVVDQNTVVVEQLWEQHNS